MTIDQGGNVDSPTPGTEGGPGTEAALGTETKAAPSAVLPPDGPAGHESHHEDETPAAVALVSVAPEILADSLGEYVKAWVKRIRSGESGALPILLGLVVIVIIFQVQQSRFLSAGF
jgi:hypothetical protein